VHAAGLPAGLLAQAMRPYCNNFVNSQMNAPEFTTETGKQVFGAANKQAAAFPVLYIPFIW